MSRAMSLVAIAVLPAGGPGAAGRLGPRAGRRTVTSHEPQAPTVRRLRRGGDWRGGK